MLICCSGFVASDSLFQVLDERHRDKNASGPTFPLIQGVLAFDTPYNGLARSMFVYGAFSNYQKVSNVFNVMTALSAAAPATLARLTTKRVAGAATKRATAMGKPSSPAWKTWQLVAVRTGTVGAIAAGGVAAYMHRKQILEGMRSMRNLKKEHVVQGYQQSVDALGQGLAYINKGNVGESFAWLSDHFTFVGALLKQNELNRRLERLAALKGVGIRDFYASLGENGYWSGGYFVPERTFCAIPAKDQPASQLFSRHVVEDASDEIVAHINLFKVEKNPNYEIMLNEAAKLAISWFNDEAEIYDDPKFAEPPPPEPAETEMIAKAVEEAETAEVVEEKLKMHTTGEDGDGDGVPDESPIDIAAAASLVPLPDDDEDENTGKGEGGKDEQKQKQAYLRHLFGIAQSTGTNLWTSLPSKIPAVEMPSMKKVGMPSVGIPAMPNMPSMPSMPSLPTMAMPKGMGLFSKKSDANVEATEAKTEGETEAKAQAGEGESDGKGEKHEVKGEANGNASAVADGKVSK